MKMCIYQITLHNGESVFSNKRDECIDKINYIIDKYQYNYAKKITLAVLDRLINVPHMTNPVIKTAKKSLIHDYYKNDIRYFIDNDKKKRTEKATEKAISRLIIKLYSIEETKIHADYDTYVKNIRNNEIKTTDKDNVINQDIENTVNQDIENTINQEQVIHTDNQINNEIREENIQLINEELIPNNEIQIENIQPNNEIEPNNNEIEPNNTEIEPNNNEIEPNNELINSNEEIHPHNELTSNNEIQTEPTQNELTSNEEIDPHNELTSNEEIPILEIEHIQHEPEKPQNETKQLQHQDKPTYSNNKTHNVSNIRNMKKRSKNKTIRHYKNSKRVKKQTSYINNTIEKYGTIEKLINSISNTESVSELAVIINIFNDKYKSDCSDKLFEIISKKILQQEREINYKNNVLANGFVTGIWNDDE